MNGLHKEKILGVGINTDFEKDILEYVVDLIENSSKKLLVVTPNPELLVIAHEDDKFKAILNGADLSLPDGVGVTLAMLLKKRRIVSKISGVDFMQALSYRIGEYNAEHQKKPIGTGFFGGRDGVAEKTADCLQKNDKNLKISYISEDFDLEAFNRSETDVLFVALGSPKQEKWMHENLPRLKVRLVMGVGGSFDMIGGRLGRAPYVVRLFGFEWLYRLLRQPWRIKRQMRLLKFAWLAMVGK